MRRGGWVVGSTGKNPYSTQLEVGLGLGLSFTTSEKPAKMKGIIHI